VREGHINVARLLIAAELPNPPKFKRTIFSKSFVDSAGRGNLRVLEGLVDDDSFPWLLLYGREALMAAVKGNVELAVKRLISWKPDLLNSRGSRLDSSYLVPQTLTRTVISLAAENGQADMVRLLLGYDDIKPDSSDRLKRTALAYAAAAGKEAVVKLLIARRDVDPNARDIKRQTPLILAVLNGHEGVVRTMLQSESLRMDMRDIDGRTALWHATESGNGQIVKLLQDMRRETEPDFSISFVFPKKQASRQSGMLSSIGNEAM
jgi:ankyrin repeat protein